MNIEKISNGSNLSVKIIGRLDTTTAPELDNFMRENLDGITEELRYAIIIRNTSALDMPTYDILTDSSLDEAFNSVILVSSCISSSVNVLLLYNILVEKRRLGKKEDATLKKKKYIPKKSILTLIFRKTTAYLLVK